MKFLKRKGIALPIALGVILCCAVWIASLSWTMSNTRSRFNHALKLRQAYFMARSGLQHFFLKMKVIQRQLPEAMAVLDSASTEKASMLADAFVEDIVIPHDSPLGYSLSYSIASFTIGSRDLEKGEMTVEIVAAGRMDDVSETIKRIFRVTR